MIYRAYNVTLRGKEKLIGDVCVSFAANGMLLLMTPDGKKVMHHYARVRVELMHALGIRITAMKEIAPDKQGRRRYQYVELHLAYIEHENNLQKSVDALI